MTVVGQMYLDEINAAVKKARKEALAEGREEGRKEGREEGRKEERKRTRKGAFEAAKRMFAAGLGLKEVTEYSVMLTPMEVLELAKDLGIA